jgi:lipopolysaccharide assembly protein A
MDGPSATAPPLQPDPPAAPAPDPTVPRLDAARSTRTSRTWTAAVLFFLVLVLLLIFVLQNGQDVEVSFLGADGTMPLAVAMLFAAVAGALLVAIPGVARIVQLRHGARRQRKAVSAASTSDPTTGPRPTL